jgi:predicted oxidoreductase
VLALGIAAVTLGACTKREPADDADVIVIGAGIAGISAAIEAEAQGARVLVIEMNSVAGGHAVKAGGFALVDTPLQRAKGFRDSAEIAYRDLMAWGEDADPGWTRFYAENATTQVYDWLVAMGVRFAVVLDTPEDTVPRFHFTRGAAVNAVVPMLREALRRERIQFAWNAEATEILRSEDRITGVRTRNTRSAAKRVHRGRTVIIATGGFEGDLGRVRSAWPADVPPPQRLLIGAGEFARGSGLQLADPLGAGLKRLDHQAIFVNGLPDPRDSAGQHGLLTQNPAAIWVDATGRRFTNEAAASKITDRAVLRNSPATHWLIFDAPGARQLTIRGAAWLSPQTIKAEILGNAVLVRRGERIAELAAAAGLPADALTETVTRYNRFIERGLDTDYGRIGPGTGAAPPPIRKPPFYAVQLFPMTRKSMGGLAIDREARVLDDAGRPIPGLFACGEATGVAGINGSFGGSGTFLGPSVLIGRVAGRSAVASLPDIAGRDVDGPAQPLFSAPTRDGRLAPPADAAALAALLGQKREGYWHFSVSHALVLERSDKCQSCHTAAWPPGPASATEQRLAQLETCTRCH